MATTKLTADGLLTTKETDPADEDTRMDTVISYQEDALLSEYRGKDVGLNNVSIPNVLRHKHKRGYREQAERAQ